MAEQPSTPPPVGTEVKEESIFNDAYDLAPYEKTMKNARIWLYVIAGAQFIMGIIEYNSVDDKTIAQFAFGIDAFLALVFLGLSLWSKKKPAVAFTIALVFYLVVVLGLAILSGDFTALFKGTIFKILVVVALIKANRDARQYEAIKRSLGEEVLLLFQYRSQPSFRFFNAHSFSFGIIFHLIPANFANAKVMTLRMCNVPTTN